MPAASYMTYQRSNSLILASTLMAATAKRAIISETMAQALFFGSPLGRARETFTPTPSEQPTAWNVRTP